MYYHARVDYAAKSQFFTNYSEERLNEVVIVPFVNGQVIPLRANGKVNRLFNMKTASIVRIYKTSSKLVAVNGESPSNQMRSPCFIKNDCTPEMVGKLKSQGTTKAVTSLIEKALQEPKRQIFVVMKFGDDALDSAYVGVYRSVAKEFGLECVRIDEVEDSGKISEQILERLAESKYVVCDLTGSRPNCYYETGFAHALGKEVILLAHKNESVHFDLAGHRFIQWSTEADLRTKFRKRLKALEDNNIL
ncbi:MAG TPA: hypothetical protein VGM52_05155 [Herbaspirillum sp.]|jgi:nucleoside 2-deoxyribosyltransferase